MFLVGNNFQFSHSEADFRRKVFLILPTLAQLDGTPRDASSEEPPAKACRLKEASRHSEGDWLFRFIAALKTKDTQLTWTRSTRACCSVLNDYFRGARDFQMNDVIDSPNDWNIFVGVQSGHGEPGPSVGLSPQRVSSPDARAYLKFRMWGLASLDLSRFQKSAIREVSLDFNRFREVPRELLGLPHLEKLSMIKNRICSLHIDRPNSSLRVLLLGNNKIYRFADVKVS